MVGHIMNGMCMLQLYVIDVEHPVVSSAKVVAVKHS
jgi:hypothetical protein